MSTAAPTSLPLSRAELLYRFCRLQMPALALSAATCTRHLDRTFGLFRKREADADWNVYLDRLFPLDWFLASACLDGHDRAWEMLFAARAGRSDCLLIDALRARATRLYPRDEERQDGAVQEFWSHLFVPERPGGLSVLGRYDGARPLVPWLIRVFQNWHISLLRKYSGTQALPDDDLALPLPDSGVDPRWRDVFAQATRDWLEGIEEREVLLLGLRLRYKMSQREVAQLLQVHEGTISRRTDALRDQGLEVLGKRLTEAGWTGDDLHELIRTEMGHLLLDDPRLSADNLARILEQLGRKLPG